MTDPASHATPRPGDVLEVTAHRVGEHGRTGEILEIVEEDGHRRYRVRWEDGHVSLLIPGSDVAVRGGRGR